MKASLRGPFLFILGVTFSGFLFSLHYTRSKDYQKPISIPRLEIQTQQLKEKSQVAPSRIISSTLKSAAVPPPPPPPLPIVKKEEKEEAQDDDCNCKSEKTGKSYNFCYVDPQNLTSIGKKFDCDHLKILEKLNLVENPGPFVDMSKTEENAKEIVFVSAVSDNHFNEATTSIAAFYKFNPNRKFILYSLGLGEIYIKNVKKDFKNLEVRVFDTTGYPNYTNHWMEYRFKPLILAEVLKEYSNVWWMDAHIIVRKPNMIELFSKEIAENVKKQETKNPVPIYFFIHASHSNFATLIPDLLTYFPTNSIPLLKDPTQGAQLGANTFFVARTEDTIEIFKWWILCALDKTCMNPPGAQVYCQFTADRNTKFAHCFRFDQSVLNLLMLNVYQDRNKYHSKIGHVF